MEAQEAAEVKMRTVQQLCEEMAEQGRRKKQAMREVQDSIAANEAKKRGAAEDKRRTDEKVRREMRESLMQDEYRLQATESRLAAAQAHQDGCNDIYDRTAGKANRDRESAELNRIDRDEKKHLMRTDAYYAQRERARERQRQNMVDELDRQMEGMHHRGQFEKVRKQAEREAVQASTKRSLDEEQKRAFQRKAEEMQLQNELRVMMAEKEERDAAEGHGKPASISTMNQSMRKNGTAMNQLDSGLTKSLTASQYMAKPLGRAESTGLDASPQTIRRLEKKFKGNLPATGTVLGGVMGSLGGGGGAVNTALMAMGGPMQPKSFAIQDIQLGSWTDGIRPEILEAGRRAARNREAAKSLANRD
jgi:hypothetical protein